MRALTTRVNRNARKQTGQEARKRSRFVFPLHHNPNRLSRGSSQSKKRPSSKVKTTLNLLYRSTFTTPQITWSPTPQLRKMFSSFSSMLGNSPCSPPGPRKLDTFCAGATPPAFHTVEEAYQTSKQSQKRSTNSYAKSRPTVTGNTRAPLNSQAPAEDQAKTSPCISVIEQLYH